MVASTTQIFSSVSCVQHHIISEQLNQIRYSLKVGTGTTFSGTKSGTKFKLLFLYLCEHFIKISKIKWKDDNFIYKIKSTLLQLIVFILLIWALLSMPVLVILVPTFRGVLLVPTSPGPF